MNRQLIKYINYSFLVLVIMVTPCCDWFSKIDKSKHETKNMQEKQNSFLLLDVNSPDIFADAHIKGSVNMSYDEVEKEAKSWASNRPIVIYCSAYECTESSRVAKRLQNLGFNNISVYKGGTHEWYQRALKDKELYPFEGSALESYLKRPIDKIDIKNDQVRIVNAEQLSELIKQSKK